MRKHPFCGCDLIEVGPPAPPYQMRIGTHQCRCIYRSGGQMDAPRCDKLFWRRTPGQVVCSYHSIPYRELPKEHKLLLKEAAQDQGCLTRT